MWEFHTGQRIAAFPRDTCEVHLECAHILFSLFLDLSLPPCLSSLFLFLSLVLSSRQRKTSQSEYPSVCARNKPLDNLCIPNGRYYLSSAAVNKIYKLDAANINSRVHRADAVLSSRGDAPRKAFAKLRDENFPQLVNSTGTSAP